jgi:hypothetical protein
MKAMMIVETQAEVDEWMGELLKLRQGATASSAEPSPAPTLLAAAAPTPAAP